LIPTPLHYFLDRLALPDLWDAYVDDVGLAPDAAHALMVANHSIADTSAADPQAYIDAVRAVAVA